MNDLYLMMGEKQIAHSDSKSAISKFILEDGLKAYEKPDGLFKNKTEITIYEMMDWASKRVFPKERTDCKKLLDEMGLNDYFPWEIAKQTRASLIEDKFWIKFGKGDEYYKDTARGVAESKGLM